jgi:hypothetical protein
MLVLLEGCVVGAGYSHRSAPGAVAAGGIDLYGERFTVGYQQGIGVHAEDDETALSVQGDLHGGWTSRDFHGLGAGRVMVAGLAHAGFVRTVGDPYGDSTFPVGLGLAAILKLTPCRALTLTTRYSYHLGDESDRVHELAVVIGYRWDRPSKDADAIFGRGCI